MDRDRVVDTLASLLDAGGDLATTLRRFAEVATAAPPMAQDRASLLGEVELRAPAPADERAWVEAVAASVDLHRDWVDPPGGAEGFAEHLERFETEDQHGYLVWWRGRLAGVVNLQNIVRSNYLGTNLGYFAFSGSEGRGVMRTAVALATDIALDELELHRVEAGIQPSNHRSIELVRSIGYRFEAYLPRLVRVGDEWHDHDLWVMTAEEWPGAAAALAGTSPPVG